MDALQKELNALLTKRAAIEEKHMQRYRDHSATRARTTTASARTGQLNERIVWLREEIKRTAVTQCADGYPSCRVAEATGKWCESQCQASAKQ